MRGKSETLAVDQISFALHEGEILGLLGPNGAGKTTTIQMLLSTLKPTSGSIRYFGKNLSSHRSEILESVSFASTYHRLPSSSKVWENLDIFGRLYGLSASQRAKNIEENLGFFKMWDLRDRKMASLSAGQSTRVMLAKAFIANPKVVLLDEPTASLDPDIALEVREFVREQKRVKKTAILFTSHNMSEVEEVCDRVLVLKSGKIIASQTPQMLAKSVSLARLQLIFSDEEQAMAEALIDGLGLKYKKIGANLQIDIDEKDIPRLLLDLARRGLAYSQISIEKPKLEDYFLHIARDRRGQVESL